MKGLDSLLGEEEPERKPTKITNEFDAIHITKYAFEKAYAYARLACEKARGTIECGGYLIAPRNTQDRIATDSFLAKNQDVSDGLFIIEAEDVIKAGREIDEMGYRVLGWWHSHGYLRTFFSAMDDNGQRTVLNEISAFNYITRRDEKEVGNLQVKTEDGKIIMFDKRSPERKYEIEVEGDPSKISIAKLRLQQEKRIGFAYGLVVNVPGWHDSHFRKYNMETTNNTLLLDEKGNPLHTKGKYSKKPYAEIATRDLCGFCKNSKDISVPVDVTVFDTGPVVIDEDSLMAEIEDRVKMRTKYFGLFSHGKYTGGQGQSPLSTQQTLFSDDDFYGAKFRTTKPKPTYIKPTKEEPLSEKEEPKQSTSEPNKLDNLLSGEETAGDNSGE